MVQIDVSFLLQKLASVLLPKVDPLIGIKDEVNQLQELLDITQSNLANFRSGQEREHAVTQHLRIIAREAEDIIDEYSSLVAFQQRKLNPWVWTKSWAAQLLDQHSMVKKIRLIKSRFEEISEEIDRLGIEGLQRGASLTSKEDATATRKKLIVEETNERFLSDFNLVMQRLMKGENGREVVTIFGMGGIGKTTLARKVYNEPLVVQNFSFRAWVDVSPGCTVRGVSEAIMKCAMGINMEDMEHMSDNELALELRKHLRSTRYLIVLDNVSDTELWESLNGIFSNNMYGSRIIITTRHKEVAIYEKSRSFAYKVDRLSKEDSWKLFCAKVFPGGTCPGDLEAIGKHIVGCCRGIPLAIVVLAGILLPKDKTRKVWSEVSSHVSLFLDQGINWRSEILELSYNALPHHLRLCFLYFSLFPKLMEIPTRQLVRLWIAEGFVYENNCQTLEEVGQDYLEELVARNLIQIQKRRFNGSIKSCFIHDFMHDFCISKGKVENFLVTEKSSGSSIPSNTRRLSFHTLMSKCMMSSPSNPRLRSLLCFDIEGEKLSNKEWEVIERNFPLLRVLDLWDNEMDSIPKHIDKLMHLKYVSLRSLTARNLPDSICNLCKLQTLEVTAPCIHRPVIDIWKLQELRHLYFQGQAVIQEPPTDFGNSVLEKLSTLRSITPDSCKESVFSKLPNLLNLGIYGDLAKDVSLAFEHLARLVSLQTLKLERDRSCKVLPSLPDATKFPPSITKLTLSETQLLEDPMSVLGQLPNLLLLKLQNGAYSGDELACGINSFPKLQVLKLVNLGIRSWSVFEGSMMSLESVVIKRCGKLDGLPLALHRVPVLRQLELWSPCVSVLKDARKCEEARGMELFKVVVYQS